MYLEDQPIEVLDSTTVAGSVFVFKGVLPYKQDVALRVKSGRQYSFVLEPGVTYVETDAHAIWTTKISGSPENDLRAEWRASYGWAVDSTNTYADRYYERQLAGQEGLAKQDSLKYAFFWKISDSLKLAHIARLIRTRPDAFVGLSLLNLSVPAFDAPNARALHGILQKHFDKHPVYREIAFKINAIENRAQIGKALPTLVIPDPHGNPVHLGDINARVLIIDFWASWCRPCREENPLYRRIYQAFHARGVEIVSVSADVKKASWLKAIEADQMRWRHVSDLQGFKGEAVLRLGIQSIPFNIILDEQKNVIATDLRGEALFNAVKDLIEKR